MIGACVTIEAVCFLEDKPVGMTTVYIVGGLCAINFFLSFGHGISMAGHVGGFIAGILCGLVIMVVQKVCFPSDSPLDDAD